MDFLKDLKEWGISDSVVTMGTQFALKVVGTILVFFLAWYIAGWLQRLLQNTLKRIAFDVTLSKFFSTVIRWLVLLLAAMACLEIFGIETTSFAAVIGAAGLAIGLAFQGTLSNLAAGVMLLAFRPFKVGDVISVAGKTGGVDEISLFTTTLDSPDNQHIILPNAQVFGASIVNITHHAERRVDIPVGTDYSADVDATRAALEGCLKDIPNMLSEPAPQIFLAGLGGSSVDWQVRVWCKTEHYWDVYQATIRAIKYALDAAEIGIPFPQMDVHIDHVNAPPMPEPPSK